MFSKRDSNAKRPNVEPSRLFPFHIRRCNAIMTGAKESDLEAWGDDRVLLDEMRYSSARAFEIERDRERERKGFVKS
jgi:hypothetical protein